jgi:FK506-binding nuclear protein
LILNSAALDPSFQGKNGHLSLFVSTDVNPDYTCICPFISRDRPDHELRVRVTGPALVQFALVNHYDDEEKVDEDGDFHSVNIFGNVKLCEDSVQHIILKAKEQFLMMNELGVDEEDEEDEDVQQVEYLAEDEQMVEEEVQIEAPKKEVKETKKEELKTPISAKKRKLSLDSKDNAPTDTTSPEPAKLTKKQRKLLAKKKAEELQKVVAKENHHEAKAAASKQVETKNVSLTKPRTIAGGIVVQDIIHGNGAAVRAGRKVSIHYTATFPETDKVFDKNHSKGSPLTFRTGTREVIRGLDQGLAGMKVGGERVITIPPKLGYGKKGSGNVPPGATLCFAVKLLSVGAK